MEDGRNSVRRIAWILAVISVVFVWGAIASLPADPAREAAFAEHAKQQKLRDEEEQRAAALKDTKSQLFGQFYAICMDQIRARAAYPNDVDFNVWGTAYEASDDLTQFAIVGRAGFKNGFGSTITRKYVCFANTASNESHFEIQ